MQWMDHCLAGARAVIRAFVWDKECVLRIGGGALNWCGRKPDSVCTPALVRGAMIQPLPVRLMIILFGVLSLFLT